MNKLILFFLIFSTPTWASVCLTAYSDADNRGIQSEKSCVLSWKDGQYEHHLEVVYAKAACQRLEGDKFEDCFFVRTCSNDPKAAKFTSAPLYSEAEYLNQYCEFSKPELRIILGAADETPRSPSIASIECTSKKATSIRLKSPRATERNCPIP